MFFLPLAAHSSVTSAMGDEGVIGKMPATSVNAYEVQATAVLPSIVFITFAMIMSPFYI
jgi:hypothetical protein